MAAKIENFRKIAGTFTEKMLINGMGLKAGKGKGARAIMEAVPNASSIEDLQKAYGQEFTKNQRRKLSDYLTNKAKRTKLQERFAPKPETPPASVPAQTVSEPKPIEHWTAGASEERSTIGPQPKPVAPWNTTDNFGERSFLGASETLSVAPPKTTVNPNTGRGTYVNGSARSEAEIREGKVLKANGEWLTEAEAKERGVTEFQEDLREKTNSGNSARRAPLKERYKQQVQQTLKEGETLGPAQKAMLSRVTDNTTSQISHLRKNGVEAFNEAYGTKYGSKREAIKGIHKEANERLHSGPGFGDYIKGYKVPQTAGGLAIIAGTAASVFGDGRKSNAELYSSPF